MDPGAVTPQTNINTLAINVIDDPEERRLFEILNEMLPVPLSDKAELLDIVVKHGEMSIKELAIGSSAKSKLRSLIRKLNKFVKITTEVH